MSPIVDSNPVRNYYLCFRDDDGFTQTENFPDYASRAIRAEYLSDIGFSVSEWFNG